MLETKPALACGALLTLVVPPGTPLTAQERPCSRIAAPGHGGWHEAWRRADTLETRIENLLGDRGVRDPTGTVHVAVGADRPDPPIAVTGVDLTDSARVAVEEVVRTFLADRPESEWLERLYLGSPDVPLWEDRTVLCAPRAVNDDEVRDAMRSLMHRHPRADNEETFLVRDKTATLGLYVNWEGRVTLVETVLPTRDVWLDDQMEDIGKTMKFEPTTLNGVPVGRWITRQVQFTRNWRAHLGPGR